MVTGSTIDFLEAASLSRMVPTAAGHASRRLSPAASSRQYEDLRTGMILPPCAGKPNPPHFRYRAMGRGVSRAGERTCGCPLPRPLCEQAGWRSWHANRRRVPFAQRHSWSYVARTWLVDQIVEREVRQGADMVINLAAGLDSRPYRMQLPASLRWIEVDLPEIVNYKQEVLAADRPVCALERVPLDLRDAAARRALFSASGRGEARPGGKRRPHRLL